jgi:hypothetical protein
MASLMAQFCWLLLAECDAGILAATSTRSLSYLEVGLRLSAHLERSMDAEGVPLAMSEITFYNMDTVLVV